MNICFGLFSNYMIVGLRCTIVDQIIIIIVVVVVVATACLLTTTENVGTSTTTTTTTPTKSRCGTDGHVIQFGDSRYFAFCTW